MKSMYNPMKQPFSSLKMRNSSISRLLNVEKVGIFAVALLNSLQQIHTKRSRLRYFYNEDLTHIQSDSSNILFKQVG